MPIPAQDTDSGKKENVQMTHYPRINLNLSNIQVWRDRVAVPAIRFIFYFEMWLILGEANWFKLAIHFSSIIFEFYGEWNSLLSLSIFGPASRWMKACQNNCSIYLNHFIIKCIGIDSLQVQSNFLLFFTRLTMELIVLWLNLPSIISWNGLFHDYRNNYLSKHVWE